MDLKKHKRPDIRDLYEGMTDQERLEIQQIVDKIDSDHEDFMRSMRRIRYMGIVTLILVIVLITSVVLSFIFPAWKRQLNIIDGSMNLLSSIISFYVFITTDRKRKLDWIPLLLLLFTFLNIGLALDSWGVFR